MRLLSDALNASILRSLLRGPLRVSELSNRLCATSRTTRFGRLRELEDLGVIVRERRSGSPPVAYCSLSPAGRELLPVVRQFARWLRLAPDGPCGPDDAMGAQAIKALAIAWDTTVLRWLAERPCSLTELDALSPREVSYHEVRKAREALSQAGLIEPVPCADRSQPYEPTYWARRAAACIAAAIRWERRSLPEPIDSTWATEIETLSLLHPTRLWDAQSSTETKVSPRELETLAETLAGVKADEVAAGVA
ncbi:MAG TPA: winged helix-turn-helix transcriptional regulator [Solirubrobacterales bacterium]|nr:winged helix-turn-helix transcriptional regulator [Solirubrobacterales bacterium]